MYLYNFRSISIPQGDHLKIKWLAHLFLAFFSPILVFLSNDQQNYKILRFNTDPHTILLLVIACSGYWYISCIAEAEKKTADINVQALKKEKRAAIIVASTVVLGLIGKACGEPGAWIYL